MGVDSIRRGTYVEAGDRRLEDPAAAHRLGVAAAVRVLASWPGGAVVSHVSAAVLHGLPVWGVPLDRVHVTRARRGGARTGRDLCVHSALLDPSEVVVRDGIAVTSVARTLVDLGRSVRSRRR
ncbi:MAG TPA: hypothetical protein VGO23_06115 [Pseudonocardia sp.]|nr:hypothetical protein [Pseudonocardia sp.]